jgi:hypothetical protein
MELGKLSTLGKLWKEHSRVKSARNLEALWKGSPGDLNLKCGIRPPAARIGFSFSCFTTIK